jgi:hypothetical protein
VQRRVYSCAVFKNTLSFPIIATSLDELARPDEALWYLKKIITIDSTFIGAYVNLGFEYNNSGKDHEAVKYFNTSLTIENDELL